MLAQLQSSDVPVLYCYLVTVTNMVILAVNHTPNNPKMAWHCLVMILYPLTAG